MKIWLIYVDNRITETRFIDTVFTAKDRAEDIANIIRKAQPLTLIKVKCFEEIIDNE